VLTSTPFADGFPYKLMFFNFFFFFLCYGFSKGGIFIEIDVEFLEINIG
jgi:hypothetical protein